MMMKAQTICRSLHLNMFNWPLAASVLLLAVAMMACNVNVLQPLHRLCAAE